MAHGDDHRRDCLARVPLFAGLGEDTLVRIASRASARPCRRGEWLRRPGDPPALVVVHRGRLRVHRSTLDGADEVLHVVGPGGVVGETDVLTGSPVAWGLESLDDGEACWLSRDAVEGLLAQDPALALRLVAELAHRLRRTEERLSGARTRSVARRLADRLLDLADEQGSDAIELPSTRRDLALWLGTTPETLSRRLGAFQDAGLVRVGRGRRVVLLDRDALAALPDDR